MVSLRNNQFHAILQGMILADAISCGQLPGGWEPRLERSNRTELNSDGGQTAIQHQQWCHQIADLLNSSKLPNQKVLPQLAQATAVADLLVMLPQALLLLEGTVNLTEERLSPNSPLELLGITFYQGLVAFLNADLAAVTSLQVTLEAIANSTSAPLAQTLALAFDQVLLAQGNFALAVGQSLYYSPAVSGLPLLTGILSAGWHGDPGIPIRLRQILNAPPPAFQQWLMGRWHYSSTETLQLWTQRLWRLWLGCSTETVIVPGQAAVLPAFQAE